MTGIRSLYLEPGKEDEKVSFCFEDLPPGIYGLRCYQDINGNGELDNGFFGPSEPWALSWKDGNTQGWPRWEDYNFIHTEQGTEVELKLEN